MRVVEVGNFMAGPFCGMQLADLGADVIKVENPKGGDMTRETAPQIAGESANFVRINRNKRSIALDLKRPDGKEIFRRLVASADIVVENLRPGTMRDLELDYERLSADHPELIYVAASGWGQDGPYAQLAGLDIIAQGMSGLMSITGEEGGGPVKIGVPMTDLVCALYGALAAVAALHARARTGRGQFIDVSLFESGVSFAIWEAGKYFTTGEVPGRNGSAHQTSAPYQALRSSDGYFTAGATTPRTWHEFCAMLGLEHLEHDERFASSTLRRKHLHELIPAIEAVTTTKPTAHWVAELQRRGVPGGAIQDFAQVFHDPQLEARNFFVDTPHPKIGSVRQLGSPMRLSETPVVMRSAGPLLGEHSEQVLAEIGFSPSEIAQFVETGTVNTPWIPSR